MLRQVQGRGGSMKRLENYAYWILAVFLIWLFGKVAS